MKHNETTVLTVPGLNEFSGIISAALKEYARLRLSEIFAPQFSLIDDTAEIGGIQETKPHLCVGRYLGHILSIPAAIVWMGIIADENVRFGVTIDNADEAFITKLKNHLAAPETSELLEKEMPRTTEKTRGCIFLSGKYCDVVFSNKITNAEKVKTLSEFMLNVDKLLHG
jgi:hypothetical protein